MSATVMCWTAPGALPSGRDDREVSSVQVQIKGLHAIVSVWNRGGFAGTLTIIADDWRHYVCALGFDPDRPD